MLVLLYCLGVIKYFLNTHVVQHLALRLSPVLRQLPQ